MTNNPFINAGAAISYIIAIVFVMFYGLRQMGPEDSVLAPIAMLSLFVLSAATMVYLYFYQPILLFLEGQKKQATELFLKTLGVFAGLTALILVFIFSLAW